MVKRKSNHCGFTLAETIVAIAILSLMAYLVYGAFFQVFRVVNYSQAQVQAELIATEKLEMARNLPYSSVGIIDGWPTGDLLASQEIEKDGFVFEVKTIIRYIDDPFDGLWPDDPNPADYKLVEVRVFCLNCHFSSDKSLIRLTTNISPYGLETESGNGVLFIRVYDAEGRSVQGADVLVENNELSPAISIYDVTNELGLLALVNIPPADESYSIYVSKSDWTSDRTYSSDHFSPSTTIKNNATVSPDEMTQISFNIDQQSQIMVSPMTEDCSPLSNLSFNLQGSRLLATDPPVYSFNQDYLNTSSETLIDNLPWDVYNLSLLEDNYTLRGTIPPLPFNVPPGGNINLIPIVGEYYSLSLLIAVKSLANGLPLENAHVSLIGHEEEELFTGRGFIRQTSWSGGAGQEDFNNPTAYYFNDGNINSSDDLALVEFMEQYANQGELISSTFDLGAPADFYQLSWSPSSQPISVGNQAVSWQLASNNDNETWDFIGPDGSPESYYMEPLEVINSSHNGDRYLRYRIILTTADENYTPLISEMSLSFSSDCLPPGQVFWGDLSLGEYDIVIKKDNYQTIFDTIEISAGSNFKEILMSEE